MTFCWEASLPSVFVMLSAEQLSWTSDKDCDEEVSFLVSVDGELTAGSVVASKSVASSAVDCPPSGGRSLSLLLSLKPTACRPPRLSRRRSLARAFWNHTYTGNGPSCITEVTGRNGRLRSTANERTLTNRDATRLAHAFYVCVCPNET